MIIMCYAIIIVLSIPIVIISSDIITMIIILLSLNVYFH